MTTTTERPRPRAPIDPRIRARRIEVAREQGRRRLRLVFSGAMAVAVVSGSFAAVRSSLLDVDRVLVEGARRTSPDIVLATAGIGPGAAMLTLPVEGAARRVEALPWVASVTIVRRWPATVVVRVGERRPAITVPDGGGGWMLVDRSGRVLAPVPAPTPEAPAVHGLARPGPPGSTLEGRGRGAVAAVRALSPEVRALLVAVEVGPGPDLVLRLRAGRRPVPTSVRLGPPTQLFDKARATATVLARVDVGAIAVLDVRVPGAPVLTRR